MLLEEGDVLLSWHEPGSGLKQLANRYFHRELLRKGEQRYPWWDSSSSYLRFDHVRLCVSVDAERTLGFEFTSPAARHFVITEDMLNWPGMRVYRHCPQPRTDRNLLVQSLRLDGTLYDLGELVAFRLPWLHKMDFGARNRVCSTGVRVVLRDWMGEDPLDDISIPMSKTLPCDFANSDMWIRML